MTFADLFLRVRQEVDRRVRNGDVTVRRLAIRAGLSQSHLQNVLSGRRSISAETADRLLGELGLTVLDLLNPDN